MIKAARTILDSVGRPEEINDGNRDKVLWAIAHTQPLILDILADLKAKDAEQDIYIYPFKISRCLFDWVSSPQVYKYLAVIIVIMINAFWVLIEVGQKL